MCNVPVSLILQGKDILLQVGMQSPLMLMKTRYMADFHGGLVDDASSLASALQWKALGLELRKKPVSFDFAGFLTR
jgi:hypothetical protein